jgi:hypothetical protein
MHVWTPAELRRFSMQPAMRRTPSCFAWPAMTGLRRGELCGLRWSALDLDTGRLTVLRALLCVHGRLVESEPKTAGPAPAFGARRCSSRRRTVTIL